MISLRRALEEEKRWNPPPVQCVDSQCRSVPMLTVSPWGEGSWLLPWSRFDYSHAVDEDNLERVELFFSHHRVVAIGENLRQILKWCSGSEVLCLRSMPAAHRANLKPTDPFISQLEVKLLAELKNPGELPF